MDAGWEATGVGVESWENKDVTSKGAHRSVDHHGLDIEKL